MDGHKMATRKKSKTSYSGRQEGTRWLRFLQLLPIYLTVGLLPFMMRLHFYDTQLSDFPWYYLNAGQVFGDTFLYYRQWWFVGISVYMFLVVLCKALLDKKSIRFSVTCIPMAVFAVFSFLSAVASEYRSFCFSGSFEQFENVWVLMGYALMVYYVFLIVESEQEVQYILYVLTASTIGLGLIGTGQTFGFNFLETGIARAFIIPSDMDVTLSSKVGEHTAYMTLYNPNYVGVYVAMLFPLYVTLLLFARRAVDRILYAVTVLLLLISLYGSGSKAAFLVLAVEMFILLVFMRRPILKYWYLVIPAATAFVAVFLLINQAQDYVYTDRIAQALKMQKTEYAIHSIETKDDGVYFNYQGNKVSIHVKNDAKGYSFEVKDENGNAIPVVMRGEDLKFAIDDSRFEKLILSFVKFDTHFGFCVTIGRFDWIFTNEYDESGTYYYLTAKGKFDKLHMAEQVIFNDYERVLSGRGYIWSVSIPLLKKHFILGSGADTFVMAFPQQDYLRLWRNGFSEQIMSKPHSLYLQVGVQDGVIALLGMLIFFVMYLGYSVRLYIASHFESFYERAGVAVMLAVLGFAVMGISNDSSITVSPIFWVLAGMGVYLNGKSAQLIKSRKSASESVTE